MGNAQIESSLDEIIVRLGKLATGNAANFEELREIRICAARRDQWERWEYKSEYSNGALLEHHMNMLGSNGWEMVESKTYYRKLADHKTNTVTWFKRRVGPNG